MRDSCIVKLAFASLRYDGCDHAAIVSIFSSFIRNFLLSESQERVMQPRIPQSLALCAAPLPSGLKVVWCELQNYTKKDCRLFKPVHKLRLSLTTDVRLTLATAETSGRFGELLKRWIRMEANVQDSQYHILGKMTYLWSLAGCLALALTFLFLKIVPVFSTMFNEFGVDLPAMTQLVIQCSNFAVRYTPWIILLIIPIVLLAVTTLDPFLSRIIARVFPLSICYGLNSMVR